LVVYGTTGTTSDTSAAPASSDEVDRKFLEISGFGKETSMLSVRADHGTRKRRKALGSRIFSLALVGAILFFSNPAVRAEGPNSQALTHVAGTWEAFLYGSAVHYTVTIAPGPIPGTYTIHGVWVPEVLDVYHPYGGDWGTGLLTVSHITQAGFSATATLHGYYPTLDVLLEWSWDSHDTMILKHQSHYVDNGVEKVGALVSVVLRRMGNL
jgi:hypothetical protein